MQLDLKYLAPTRHSNTFVMKTGFRPLLIDWKKNHDLTNTKSPDGRTRLGGRRAPEC